MTTDIHCPHCACSSADGLHAHAVLKLLAVDDIGAALEHGLLDALACATCEPRCNTLLANARDARLTALAARERYRARSARLARREAERDAARIHATPVQATPAQVRAPALPAAAADALARALAKARKPR